MLEFIMKRVIVNWVFVVLFLVELNGKDQRYNIFVRKLFHLLTELPVLM